MVASACTACSLRLAVRTLASHAGNRGSIPLGSANSPNGEMSFPTHIRPVNLTTVKQQRLSEYLLNAGQFSSVEESFGAVAYIFHEFGFAVGRMGLAIIPIYETLDGIHLLATDETERKVLRLDREAGFFDSDEHRNSIIAHVMNTNAPIRLNLTAGEGCDQYEFLRDLKEKGFRDYFITPIGRQETVRFILSITTRRPTPWSDAEMATMNEFFAVLGYVVESFELSRMIFLASQDPLTRLLNRRAFDHEARKTLDFAKNREAWSAMIFFDIDKFKSINDTYGHDFGDLCIVKAAKIGAQVGEEFGGICGRLGGEEFVIFFPQLNPGGDSSPVDVLFDRIRTATLQHETSEKAVSFTVSAGCVYIAPDAPQGFDEVIKRANALMHQAKKGGRNRYFEERLS